MQTTTHPSVLMRHRTESVELGAATRASINTFSAASKSSTLCPLCVTELCVCPRPTSSLPCAAYPTPAVLCSACLALAHATTGNLPLKKQMCEPGGGVELVVLAMNTHPAVDEVQTAAMEVLFSLSYVCAHLCISEDWIGDRCR